MHQHWNHRHTPSTVLERSRHLDDRTSTAKNTVYSEFAHRTHSLGSYQRSDSRVRLHEIFKQCNQSTKLEVLAADRPTRRISLGRWVIWALPSLPDYALPHLSLIQSHEPKSFNHFYILLSRITNHLSKYHSSFVFVIIVLLLLLSLSLFALVSYSVLLIYYSAIRLLSRKCGIKLSDSVDDLSVKLSNTPLLLSFHVEDCASEFRLFTSPLSALGLTRRMSRSKHYVSFWRRSSQPISWLVQKTPKTKHNYN